MNADFAGIINCAVSITYKSGQLAQHSGPSDAAPEDFGQDVPTAFLAQQVSRLEMVLPTDTDAFIKKGNAASSKNRMSRQVNDMKGINRNGLMYTFKNSLNDPGIE